MRLSHMMSHVIVSPDESSDDSHDESPEESYDKSPDESTKSFRQEEEKRKECDSRKITFHQTIIS